MKCFILFLCMAFLLSSCSIYNIANHHVSGKLLNGGLRLREAHLAGYSIRYWDSGKDKPVLVLLHGFGPPTQFQWYKQISALTDDYRLILPNLLYFGGSTADSACYSVADQVKAMQALPDSLGVEKYALCGVSFGGLVAAELALADQNKIEKLILVDAPVKFFTEEDLKPLYKKYNAETPSELLVPRDHRMLKEMLNIAYKHPPKFPLWMFKNVYRKMVLPNMEDRKCVLETLLDEQSKYANRTYRYPFPVLLVWGEEDSLIPLHVGRSLEKHIGPGTRLEVIPNTAHMPNLETPKRFNRLVRSFLEN